MFQCIYSDDGMEIVRSSDVHSIQLFLFDHFLEVSIDGSIRIQLQLFDDFFTLLWNQIAESCNFYPFVLGVSVQMPATHSANPHTTYPQFFFSIVNSHNSLHSAAKASVKM